MASVEMPLYRLTDLYLPFQFLNDDDSPTNMTGAGIAVVSDPEIGATVVWTDAATGQALIEAPWSEVFPSGRNLSLRVITTQGGRETGWPPLWVAVE